MIASGGVSANDLLAAAGTVVLQMQQPIRSSLRAARLARAAGTRVVLDGAPPPGDLNAELMAKADVVRADARESEQLTGTRLDNAGTAFEAAREVLRRGPELVVLEVAEKGNLFVTNEDKLFLPLADTPIVDTTGSGDALIAALVTGLARGDSLGDLSRAPLTLAADDRPEFSRYVRLMRVGSALLRIMRT